jgi:hypothetical protein
VLKFMTKRVKELCELFGQDNSVFFVSTLTANIVFGRKQGLKINCYNVLYLRNVYCCGHTY